MPWRQNRVNRDGGRASVRKWRNRRARAADAPDMTRIDGTRERSNDFDAASLREARSDAVRPPAATGPSAPSRATDASVEQRQSRIADSPQYLAFLTNVAGTAASTGPGERIRDALDAFRDRFSGPYTVDAGSVSARPMFRMNGSGFNQKKMEAHLPELARLCARAKVDSASVMACAIGRSTPEQLVKVTQALIDAGKLPPPPGEASERIRAMQWEWGVGVDCAGYTARAAQAAHGSGAASLIGNDKDYFSQMMRDRTHFTKVAVADIRSGDVIHLNAPEPGSVGHNVIVHSHTIPGTLARDELARQAEGAAELLSGVGPFHVLTVDSSWGAGEHGADYGGFRRDTWIHDAHSGEWGYFTPTTPKEFQVSERGPQDEPFGGAYRPKATS